MHLLASPGYNAAAPCVLAQVVALWALGAAVSLGSPPILLFSKPLLSFQGSRDASAHPVFPWPSPSQPFLQGTLFYLDNINFRNFATWVFWKGVIWHCDFQAFLNAQH